MIIKTINDSYSVIILNRIIFVVQKFRKAFVFLY